jgi:hypothetical protein
MVFGGHRAARVAAVGPCRLAVLRVVVVLCVLAGLDVLATPAGIAAAASNEGWKNEGWKTVRYQGYRFEIPDSWPVVDDTVNRRRCVRFDEHALYLGAVSSEEFCPSWLLGTTESMLIQPGPAAARTELGTDSVARQVAVQAPRIVITATYDTDPGLIRRILASAGLPVAPPSSPAGFGGPASIGMHYPMARPPLPATVTSYIGLGFDACAAPSGLVMRAWRRDSPYRAIGIYIGGADRACAQPNLSRSWVLAQARAGWRFIPMYAGPQAAFGELNRPIAQGRAAAADAVNQARRLGFGPRTPLYYDMEAFAPRSRIAALRFLSAWTATLHRLGYRSGVYSSSDSGVVDLARQYFRRVYAMPDIIFDALWNGRASTNDSNLHAAQWPRHRRIHQFSGNVTATYGGHTINIDKDFLDVRVTAAAATSQSTSAVTLPDGAVLVFYLGPRRRLWLARRPPGSGWTSPAATGLVSASAPSVVWTGSAVDVFFTGAAGYLWVASYRPDGSLISRQRLSMMGVLGSGPRAIAQSDGVIDVFWHGSVDDHLWHGQYTPGSGWNGPQGLGGNLASAPSPVAAPGCTAVFWKGTDGSLWEISRGLTGKWTAPRSLGMTPLGGAPQATTQPSGDIEVYWRGSGNPYLWEAFFTPRTGWRGPRDLGGAVRSAPWPVTAASGVLVLWRGPAGRLYVIEHRATPNWNVLGWTGPAAAGLGWTGSAPFAAVGAGLASVPVFWQAANPGVWTALLTGADWTQPVWLGA